MKTMPMAMPDLMLLPEQGSRIGARLQAHTVRLDAICRVI
jgi:hypothetical protein